MHEPNQTCTVCGGRGWTGTPDARKKCQHCKQGWVRVELPKPAAKPAHRPA